MPWRGILLVCLGYLAALQLITARVFLTVNEEYNDLVPTLHSSKSGDVSLESCMRDCYGPTWEHSTPPNTAVRFTGSLQREYCPLRTCTSFYRLSAQYPVDGVSLSVTITRLDDEDRLRVDLRCYGNGYDDHATLNGTRVEADRLEWSETSIDEEHGWFNYREQLVGGGTARRWTWKGGIDCEENTPTTTIHASTTEVNPTTVSGSVTSTYSTAASPASNTTANSTSSPSANPTPTSSSPASSADASSATTSSSPATTFNSSPSSSTSSSSTSTRSTSSSPTSNTTANPTSSPSANPRPSSSSPASSTDASSATTSSSPAFTFNSSPSSSTSSSSISTRSTSSSPTANTTANPTSSPSANPTPTSSSPASSADASSATTSSSPATTFNSSPSSSTSSSSTSSRSTSSSPTSNTTANPTSSPSANPKPTSSSPASSTDASSATNGYSSAYTFSSSPSSNTSSSPASRTEASSPSTGTSPLFNAASTTSSGSDEHVDMSVRNPLQTTIIASATAGGALLIIILIIIVVMCKGKRANNSSTKTPKNSKDVPLTVTNGDSETPSPSSPIAGSRKATTRSDSGYSMIDVNSTLKKNSGLNSNVYKLKGNPEPSNTTDLYTQVDGHKPKEGGMPKQVADIYTEVKKPSREPAGQAGTTTIPGCSGQTQDLQKRSAAPNTTELYTLVNKPTRPTEIPLVDMVENDIYNT